MQDFSQRSYELHREGYKKYSLDAKEQLHSETWLRRDTVDAWRHLRMYQMIDPLLSSFPDAYWLTVGDGRFGKDAHYIREKGPRVLATDISDSLLVTAKEIGYIEDYRVENAESLSFPDGEFDFVFCKESLHHFPRPMIGLYEMLRVARRGVVLIEPNDLVLSRSVLEILLRTVLGKRRTAHTYEPFGNYVYSVSEREIEKVAVGMNLGAVAFRGLNDYYVKGVEYASASPESSLFQRVSRGILLRDLLCKLKVVQPGLLVAVILNDMANAELSTSLSESGYRVTCLPKNPHMEGLP